MLIENFASRAPALTFLYASESLGLDKVTKNVRYLLLPVRHLKIFIVWNLGTSADNFLQVIVGIWVLFVVWVLILKKRDILEHSRV